MASTIGHEHAARIINARNSAASHRAWQIRKGEILRSEIPIFFSAMADELKCAANAFNELLRPCGHIEVSCSELEIIIRSGCGRNFLSRKITRQLTGETAAVATDKVQGYKRQSTKIEILFDVRSDGAVLLEGRNFLQAADWFFGDAADACAE